MADGIFLERRGVPAVSICTDTFVASAEAMAKLHGFPGYAFVTVPHPVASLQLAEMQALARSYLGEVLAIVGVGR